MIQITDKKVPNGRHLRVQHTYGWEDVSSNLIQQGEGEVDEDPAARRRGVDGAAVLRQGFAKLSERERCHGREREAPGAWVRLPSLPPLYIGPLGGGPRD